MKTTDAQMRIETVPSGSNLWFTYEDEGLGREYEFINEDGSVTKVDINTVGIDT